MGQRILRTADATTLNTALTALSEPLVQVKDQVVSDAWVAYYTALDPTTASAVANLDYLFTEDVGMLNGVTRILGTDVPEPGEVIIPEALIASGNPAPPAAPPVGGGANFIDDFSNLDSLAVAVAQHDLALPPGGVGYKLDLGGTNNDLTGIVAGSEGTLVLLFNVSASGEISLAHDEALSTAGNRFFCPNGSSLKIRENGSAYVRYEPTLGSGAGGWHVVTTSE